MLTPKFTISQNDEFVIIVIRVPYVKISSAEFFLDVYNFRFHLNPYLLNITFKQPLKPVNEEPTSSKYNQDTYELTVNLKNCGFNNQYEDFFEDLEEEILELGDINPDIVSINDRIQVRQKKK
ncbi:hypothetical protein PPERSA_04255 [Pseudocohnilembus persalinus]|uniref:CS domain-containing protein n=1 Tax=Pseudocohnilembus persalinus TaxID=266149 RepID=A0A0V0QN19_PSEPJ|nr:hypothetical protein PPERSA_04255 [Pseudocohnilembus persalinus]|eukprot:KRX03747.1 hypothetical protein PPERSA_04255 [Pseudocohnilembus persalinus]